MVGQVYPKGFDTKKENTMTHHNDITFPTELIEQVVE